MIIRTLFFLLIFTLNQASYAETNNFYEPEDQKKNVAFNEGVTNDEIIEYLELVVKFDPDELEKFRSWNPKKLRAFLIDYRKSYTKAGIKIPILRGMSKDEIKELEIIAKYSASESIKVESAQKRLLSFSSDQYKLMIIEAAKLIRKHRKHNSGAFFRRVTINNEFPDKLAFLNLDSIYVYESYCELVLQNGIGKDIGYIINRDKSDEWQIKSYDHYKSPESNRIIGLDE